MRGQPLAKYNVKQICERAEKAFNLRDVNRQTFDDCYELYSPYRNTLNKQGQTFNKATRQYDSTGQNSAQNFINTIQSNFTPVFTKWASIVAGDLVPEDMRSTVNEMFEKITDQIFSYLNASNFATASSEMYFEWGIGTGCLWLYEGDDINPLNFVCTPISQIGIDEGKYGTIDFRCRKYKLKAAMIQQTWKKAVIPAELQGQLTSNPDAELEVLEAFYYDYDDFIHCYDVIIEGQHKVYEEKMAEEMVFTPRWLKIAGQPYGVGPFVMALADTKTLNKLKEFLLRSAALDVAGVYTITADGAINPNNINIAPNTFIPVERNNGEAGPTIQRLDTSSNFQLQEYMATDLKDSIRKALLDNRLPAETPQPKTAFEIAQRMREFQVNIGSAYGRGMFEFIQPLFKRILGILNRKGLIELPNGFTLDNLFARVKITSPIAQTQQAEEVQKVLQNYQMVQMISPELALTSYEVEKFPSWLTEMTGAPIKLLRSEAEQSQLQQIIAQQVIAMQQQGAQNA
jgi:hypothetical protein